MFGDTFELDLLKLIFNATAIANIADNAGTSPLTNLYLALHTADPGEAGDQTTSEATYTGYARQAVARTTGGWTCATASGVTTAINAALAQFAQCTGGSNSITWVSVGVASSGASKILCRAPVGSNVVGKGGTAKASTDTITIPGHSLSVNDQCVANSNPALALAGGLTEGNGYYIKTVSGNDVTLSTTQGGATLDITSDGDVILSKLVPLAVSVNITPQFAAGQLKFQLD